MFEDRRELRVALDNSTCIEDLVLISLYKHIANIRIAVIVVID